MEYNQNNSNVNNPQYLQQMMQEPTGYNYQNNSNVNNPQYLQQMMQEPTGYNYQNNSNVNNLQYSQQTMEQQIMNQMMQQSTGYNYQNNTNEINPWYSQQQVGYGGVNNYQTNQLQPIKIRNLWSLISAVLLFIAMVSSEFVHCVDYGDWSKSISLSDLCSQISRSTKGWESDYKIFVVFAGCMFYITIATFIISVLGGFVEVTILKIISGVLSVLCIIVLTFVIFSKEIYLSDETSFGTGYYVLVVGIVGTIVSIFKDNPPKHLLYDRNDLVYKE